MDFGLSEEQRLLEQSVRSFLAEQVPIERVRELRDNECVIDRSIWKSLAELGMTGILVAVEHGGSGMTLLDAALVAQAIGHAATPAPFLPSSILTALALQHLGGDSGAAWLRGIASGEVVFAAAVTELFSRREDAGLQLDGKRISGKSMMAQSACAADYILVAVDEDTLAVVRRDAPQLIVAPLSTIDQTRCTSELLFDSVPTEAVFRDCAATITRALDGGRITLAADTLGCCESMIERAVAYAKERKQFNRVIGSFQAVKHMCAEMIAEIEPARSLLWYAAHSFDAKPEESSLMACHALAHISEIGREIASIATQVHGGTGWTDEQNVHFWFKRIANARHLLGGPEFLRSRAADLQGLSAAATGVPPGIQASPQH